MASSLTPCWSRLGTGCSRCYDATHRGHGSTLSPSSPPPLCVALTSQIRWRPSLSRFCNWGHVPETCVLLQLSENEGYGFLKHACCAYFFCNWSYISEKFVLLQWLATGGKNGSWCFATRLMLQWDERNTSMLQRLALMWLSIKRLLWAPSNDQRGGRSFQIITRPTRSGPLGIYG